MQPRPRRAAAAAVSCTWLEPAPPPVTSVSAPRASASPQRNSSLRALLPPRRCPVRSSRLTHTSRPTASDSRGAVSNGVGSVANGVRGRSGNGGDIRKPCPPTGWAGPGASWGAANGTFTVAERSQDLVDDVGSLADRRRRVEQLVELRLGQRLGDGRRRLQRLSEGPAGFDAGHGRLVD